MINRIEASHFRCFHKLSQTIDPLEILVGPNGSGKSAFLDVLALLGALASDTVQHAVEERSDNFQDLVWGREGHQLTLAIEAAVPRDPGGRPPAHESVRYEIVLSLDVSSESVGVSRESLVLQGGRVPPSAILQRDRQNATFAAECGNNRFTLDLHPNYTGLYNLPVSEAGFPTATWLKTLLRDSVRIVSLDTELLRRASPPGQSRALQFNGRNLPRLVAQLEQTPVAFGRWEAHLRTALPDLETIRTVLRPEDKHRYIILRAGGVEVPQWVVSDGTLRLLALTIIPYLEERNTIYLIEEPETGVHPTALETIFQSLSSVYDGQVLMTSHSPLLLALARPEQLLCFARTPDGAEVTRGDQHPALRDWTCDINLSDLFASGVLG